MITYKDIKKVVNTKLTNEFGIEINGSDVKEGFNRPSFFVSFDNQIHSSDQSQSERSLTIRIYYFPTDQYDYSLEILDVQEQLENLFDLKLPVLDRKFNIHESSSLVTDGVLEFSFDIQFFDGKEISLDTGYVDKDGNPIQIELMQNLEIKRG